MTAKETKKVATEEVVVATPEKDKTEAWYGTGRRKSSIARVRITLGKGEIIVNEKSIEVYFPSAASKIFFESPLMITGRLGDISATVKVRGGGKESQLGAVVHGFARALVAYDSALRPALSRAKLLRRDPRMKESKHFGLMGARKAKQSPKR